ncbi:MULTISPECIES: DUF262 domain-containing protein [unclassified Chryseobacterium]|uniref:DUF262 domain-containing protein n=1 Tax=unclassified Chryseobacterium TaxID=2593645 RepID=UPI003016F1CA
MTENKIQEITVFDLFKDKDKKYSIPIYQRDYAWEKHEIEQLLNDIISYLEDGSNEFYYIGSMIVFPKENNNNEFEVIDGQQRLTTFYLLLNYLNDNFALEINSELSFENRAKSITTLEKIRNKESCKEDEKKLNLHIIKGYNVIENYFKEKKDRVLQFLEYLKKVVLMQISVPKKTDLNHYFEIMNNRGEQLTEVELIRAKFYSKIYGNNQEQAKIFKQVWDSVASMENYFEVEFKYNNADWKEIYPKFEPDKQSSNAKTITDKKNKKDNNYSLKNILDSENKLAFTPITDKTVKYTSILHFENFLMLVYSSFYPENLSLDKKKLLDTLYSQELGYEFILNFTKRMIKYRIIFDRYIIKRQVEDNTEKNEWDIKIPASNGSIYYKKSFGNSSGIESDNDEIIIDSDLQTKIKLLQSMFKVTYPDQNSKYWLYGFMKFLDKNVEEFTNENEKSFKLKSPDLFMDYLTNVADYYVFKNYLNDNPDNAISRKDIACIEDFNEYNFQKLKSEDKYFDFNNEVYKIGTAVPNFIFNYIEYKIYEDLFFRKNKILHIYKSLEIDKLKDYHYQYNNSVEHLYAQNQKLDADKILNIDNLGNLCLLTTSLNSTLSNANPKNKFKYMIANGLKNSLKMHLMYALAKSSDENLEWNDYLVQSHFNDIMELMKSDWIK